MTNEYQGIDVGLIDRQIDRYLDKQLADTISPTDTVSKWDQFLWQLLTSVAC